MNAYQSQVWLSNNAESTYQFKAFDQWFQTQQKSINQDIHNYQTTKNTAISNHITQLNSESQSNNSIAERTRKLREDLMSLKPIELSDKDVAYNNFTPETKITIDHASDPQQNNEDSPFTQFLAQMNRKINQQVIGIDQNEEQDNNNPSCWLYEPGQTKPIPVTSASYTPTDLQVAKTQLKLLKQKLLKPKYPTGKTQIIDQKTAVIQKSIEPAQQVSSAIESVNIKNNFDLNNIKVQKNSGAIQIQHVNAAKTPLLKSSKSEKQISQTLNLPKDSRQKCVHCDRAFCEIAYEKHILLCESKAKSNALKRSKQASATPRNQINLKVVSSELSKAIKGVSARRKV